MLLVLDLSSLEMTGTRRLRCPICVETHSRECVLSVTYRSVAPPVLPRLRQHSSVRCQLDERRAHLVDVLLQQEAAAEPSPASSSESWPGAVGMTVLPEQGQPPLCSLLQPARPRMLTSMGSLECWRDFLSKIQTVWPRVEQKGKSEMPICKYRRAPFAHSCPKTDNT